MAIYKFDGMDAWYERHKEALLQGKGFTGLPKKTKYIPIHKETNKERAWAMKHIHYGEEYNKDVPLIKEHILNGHSIRLWANGNLTCDCKGWIFKRVGIPRECRHTRELYAQMTDKPIPGKKKPKVEVNDLISRIENMIKEGLT